MTQIGTFPTGLAAGQPENVADVVTALNQIKTVVNGNLDATNITDASLTTADLSASAAIADTQLASPNNVAYKQITSTSTFFNGHATGTYVIAPTGIIWGAAALTAVGLGLFYLDPADYAVAGKTTKYRVRASLAVNATAPTSTFTFGLYPVTAVAGTANANSLTLGSVTAGSTAAFAAPSASTLAQVNSGDFTAPVAGYYILGVAISVAGMAANSAAHGGVILQVRNV